MAYPLHLPAQGPLLTVTQPAAALWVIELHNGEDNRLTEHFIQHAILPALAHVERAWRDARRDAQARKDAEGGKGALVVTGKRGQDKFFSNGFDYPQVVADPGFIPNTFNVLLRALLSFPIPTVAAINGHVFAAGFILALACDYRVIAADTQRRVWGCMNEVHFGAPLPFAFAELLRTKIRDAPTLRRVALEGARLTPAELARAGLVDAVADGGTEAVVARACALAAAWGGNARTGVWGLIRKSIYRVAVEATARDLRTVHAEEEDRVARTRL